jgi:phage replication initiation protein
MNVEIQTPPSLKVGEAQTTRGAQRRGAAEPLPSPRAVTRGESSQRCKVDWLHASFPAPDLSPLGFVQLLGKHFQLPTDAEERGGIHGFKHSLKIAVWSQCATVDCALLAYGGESQKGRWFLQLTGTACRFIKDWHGFQTLLEDLGAKLTRVDLAADFLEGEYTVDDAVEMHAAGGFSNGGNSPKTSCNGDWLQRVEGRTLYVGKAQNGKMLRVYEKGKQLGDSQSPWVRYEVQLVNRDREIPLDVLTHRDMFFAGCYPALADLIESASERIPTSQTETRTTLAHLMYHLKRCYGKVFHQLAEVQGATHTALVEEFRVIGIPRRLDPSGVVSGLDWPELLASMKRKEK